MPCSSRRLTRTLATPIFKRVFAGSLLFLFWIAIIVIHDRPLSVASWASLVPLRCPLAWILDIQCPTCGLGRSLVAAALGHTQESFHFHPFGLPIFWGIHGLIFCWMVWPRAWEKLRLWCRIVLRKKPLLWSLVIIYSLWGFCWRVPI